MAKQNYRSVCDRCEKIVEVTLDAACSSADYPTRLSMCEPCNRWRVVFMSPQHDTTCAAYYSKQHPAAAAEAKAAVDQLDAGVDPDAVELGPRLTAVKDRAAIQATFIPRNDWRKLPKRPPTVVPGDCRQFVQDTRTNEHGLREVQVGDRWYVDTAYELDRRDRGGAS